MNHARWDHFGEVMNDIWKVGREWSKRTVQIENLDVSTEFVGGKTIWIARWGHAVDGAAERGVDAADACFELLTRLSGDLADWNADEPDDLEGALVASVALSARAKVA